MTERVRRIDDEKHVWDAAAALLNLAGTYDLTAQQAIDALFTALTTVAAQAGWSYDTYCKFFLGSAKVTFDGLAKAIAEERKLS